MYWFKHAPSFSQFSARFFIFSIFCSNVIAPILQSAPILRTARSRILISLPEEEELSSPAFVLCVLLHVRFLRQFFLYRSLRS